MMNFLYHKRKNGAGVELTIAESAFSQLSISEYLDKNSNSQILDCHEANTERGWKSREEENCNRLNLLEIQDKTRSCRKACLIGSKKDKRIVKDTTIYFSRPSLSPTDTSTKSYSAFEETFHLSFLANIVATPAITVHIKLSEDQYQSIFPFFYYKCLLEYTIYRLFKSCFMCSKPKINMNFEEDNIIYCYSNQLSSDFYNHSANNKVFDNIYHSWKSELHNIDYSLIRNQNKKRYLPAISASTSNTDCSNDIYYADSSSEEYCLMDID